MTFNPAHPAPILDDHIRRIRAYLQTVATHEAYAAAISKDLGIPRGTLDGNFFIIRAQAAGVERISIPTAGRLRSAYTGYRLADDRR